MISAIVITFNEERNIGRCLASLAWTDEVVLVDSGSVDRTVPIAAGFGAKILTHPYDTDIRQRRRGFDAASGEWLLVVDADEEVPPELAAEIRSETGGPGPAAGYEIARKVSFHGRWILHGGWYPGYSFRLFRKDSFITEDAVVHGGYTTAGRRGRLKHPLHHYSYDSIGHYLEKMNDYTSLQLRNLERSRPGWKPGPAKIVFSPLSHFVRNYFVRRGFLDGVEGFTLAVLDSLYSLALYSKTWERAIRTGAAGPAPPVSPPVSNEEIRKLKSRY